MKTEKLEQCLDFVIEAIEENQEATKALELARAAAYDTVARADSRITELHLIYDELETVKKALFNVNGYPSE